MSQRPLRIGTRGSRLARVQTDMVAAALAKAGVHTEILPIKTSGDRIQDRSLADAGGKGLFTKELEEALLAGTIDLAVHSMKDVPVALPEGLSLAAILPREDPSDAFLSHKAASLAELPEGARIGTSSVRRQAQILRARPDIVCSLMRGNVDTRLAKLDAGDSDALLLSLAGLKRLGLADRVTRILPTEDWLPALAQGAVGIEIRQNDAATRAAVAALNHAATALALDCERAFQAVLDGSCRTPIAGLAEVSGKIFRFRGMVLAPDGSDCVRIEKIFPLDGDGKADAVRVGREAGETLKPLAAGWLAR